MKLALRLSILWLLLAGSLTCIAAFDGAVAAYKQGDYSTAISEFIALANDGHAGAQYHLGNAFLEGHGVAKDESRALDWYRKAAEQGNVFAQYRLGVMYEKGIGVKKHNGEALSWYGKAADQGHSEALNAQGKLRGTALFDLLINQESVTYQTTNGGLFYMAKDYESAFQWYRKAADQGDASAQAMLGLMYAQGQGVALDDAEAVRWYRIAAEQGNSSAQWNLGLMYAGGRGVPRNDARAVYWLAKSAQQHPGFDQKILMATSEDLPKVRASKNVINIFKQPSVNNAAIRTLSKSDLLFVLDTSRKDWYEIYSPTGYTLGWVQSSDVKK